MTTPANIDRYYLKNVAGLRNYAVIAYAWIKERKTILPEKGLKGVFSS